MANAVKLYADQANVITDDVIVVTIYPGQCADFYQTARDVAAEFGYALTDYRPDTKARIDADVAADQANALAAAAAAAAADLAAAANVPAAVAAAQSMVDNLIDGNDATETKTGEGLADCAAALA